MHLVRILIMLCSVISAALLVSATVGIAWGKHEGENGKTYFGLWKVCDGIICHKFKESTVERKYIEFSASFSFIGISTSFLFKDCYNNLFHISQNKRIWA